MPEPLLGRSTDRRTLMRGATLGLVGLAGAALIGCSDDNEAGAGAAATATGGADVMAKGTADTMAKGTPDAMTNSGAMNDAMAADVALGLPKRYPLVNGWYRGRDARYWDFGMASPANASGTVSPAAIYAFITGMNPDGSPRLVQGQHNVIDVIPGEQGYSDLWQVMLVTVPSGFEADSIRSKADLDASGLRATAAGTFVNCPVVPAGSTVEGGPDLVQGWYRGQHAFYPDFGMNPPTSIPIWAFATGTNADGSPRLVEGQRNVIDAAPGQPGYSAFWRVHMVMVNAGYQANAIKSASEVATSGLPVVDTPMVVNCPVESPRV